MARKTLSLALIVLVASAALANDLVEVAGSNHRFPTPHETKVGAQDVKLVLTGAAVRKKFVNIYAVGSYLQEGVAVRSAEQLAAADCPKRLHIVMERTVPGETMAQALRDSIRRNYDAPLFTEELKAMERCLQAHEVKKGDQVWLTHVPKKGLHVSLVGKAEVLIENPQFSQAVWNIYLGPNNLGDTIKQGLLARLPR